MEIPRPVWAMCSSIWPNSPRIFSQHLIENFHGKALPFTLHLHLLLHSDTAGDNMRIPPQLSLLQAEANSRYTTCFSPQPSLNSPSNENLGLVWVSSAWVRYCQWGLTCAEQRKPATLPWCAGDAAPYAFSLHCPLSSSLLKSPLITLGKEVRKVCLLEEGIYPAALHAADNFWPQFAFSYI